MKSPNIFCVLRYDDFKTFVAEASEKFYPSETAKIQDGGKYMFFRGFEVTPAELLFLRSFIEGTDYYELVIVYDDDKFEDIRSENSRYFIWPKVYIQTDFDEVDEFEDDE